MIKLCSVTNYNLNNVKLENLGHNYGVRFLYSERSEKNTDFTTFIFLSSTFRVIKFSRFLHDMIHQEIGNWLEIVLYSKLFLKF